jgi:hypothetical protein
VNIESLKGSIVRLNANKLAASSFFSGSMMANSYRKHATTAMMPVMEAKRAESPKASGPYMRVMMGAAKILRNWAMAVPPASLRTSETKDERPSKILLKPNLSINKFLAKLL